MLGIVGPASKTVGQQGPNIVSMPCLLRKQERSIPPILAIQHQH